MDLYLPIAGITENVLVLLGIGTGIGLLSGMFGVGGGFLMTPVLMFLGVPSPVAVATGANQVAGASVSGVLAHWRRGHVDVKMGSMLLVGGLVGSGLGVWLFHVLQTLGQIDLTISLSYVTVLGLVGSTMLVESAHSMLRGAPTAAQATRSRYPGWILALPFKMRFPKSRIYVSAIVPVMIGFAVGVLSAIMGVGGGFVMVPAMIYLLRMPTQVVVGTSLFQVIFVTANVAFLQSITTHTVDVLLMTVLLVGGVVGAQVGARLGGKMKADFLRLLLALLVLAVGTKLVYDLTATPLDLFSLVTLS